MSKRKPNIRLDLVGELFTNGKDVYRLIRCETEPKAVMIELSNPAVEIEKPISFFANFVQLKPISPIEKPRKPRADLGKHHKKATAPGDKQKTVDAGD